MASSSHGRAKETSSDAATLLPASPTTTPVSTAQASAVEPSVVQLGVLESVDVGEGSMADSNQPRGREDYLRWKDYFMGVALLAAKRSKDPRTKVGACIVGKDKKILGIGYNGMPAGCEEDPTEGGIGLPWKDNDVDPYKKDCKYDAAWMGSKYPYVCHAASNAIQFSSGDLKGSTMYTTLYPVYECAKRISQAGITKVVYLERDKKMKYATGITEQLFSRHPVIKLKEFHARRHPEIKLEVIWDEFITIKKKAEESPSNSANSGEGRSTPSNSQITWDQYHMAQACLAADRSKDEDKQVGACIIDDDHKVVGIGWNGMPKGDDGIDWSKKAKMKFVCHAEFNALMHKTVASVKGCTMYVTLHPCNCCAKDIIQAGIKEVIFLSWSGKKERKEFMAAERLLKAAPKMEYSSFNQGQAPMEPIVLKLTSPTVEYCSECKAAKRSRYE